MNRFERRHTLNYIKLNYVLVVLVSLFATRIVYVQAARENPLKDPRICGRPQCDLDRHKFGYGESIYKYDYSLDIRSEFAGTGMNSSDLVLKASLDLFFPKPCEGYLRINSVQFWDKLDAPTDGSDSDSTRDDGDAYDYYGEPIEKVKDYRDEPADKPIPSKNTALAEALKANMLRFAFHDGQISEVCPNTNEPVWVLNFKKGILSAFQNTMMRFDVDYNTTEVDISGKCNVYYTLESTDNAYVTIRKVKDISSCRNRYSTHSRLQTVPYTFRDDKTIWPILNSESYCNMTIDSNLYRLITCHEQHQLIPFSNSSSGAMTTTNSKLEFQSKESYSSKEILTDSNAFVDKRSSLIFDHTPSIKPTHGEIKASRELLKKLCDLGFPNIQREFINVFTDFLQTTKSLDYKTLTQLLARSASICEHGRNHVLESLPYIGSTASFQVMRDEIIGNNVPKALVKNWLISLSFTQRPDEETLDTFHTILEFARNKIDPEYTLAASSVIHNFVVHNSKDHPKIQKIVYMMETEFLNLFNMFHGERGSRERMIVILKGLSNIGVISEEFAEQLQNIIITDNSPVDLRLQAVLAFRRVDCMLYRRFFLNTYANVEINSEIRIQSYLQTMRCPDYKSIKEIRSILDIEEVNQVGSFVWSHLKNLAKTSSPISIETQGLLLNDDELSDKFKMDIRKFSRNYEHSLFFDEYNFGSSTDLNLVFGTESFLPRTANLNFTTHLFGQSVNFFEMSLRAEGFEELVASAFGPKGPFSQDVLRKKFSFLNRWIGRDQSEQNEGPLDELFDIENLRFKRSVSEHEHFNDNSYEDEIISEFAEDYQRPVRDNSKTEAHKRAAQREIDNLGYNLNYEYNNPRAQIGLRVFGNDLHYFTSEGILEVMALAKQFDPFHQASKILSGKEVTYSESRVFLDASYNVPLAVGIPLAIHAFGASSLDLRISGNLERIESAPDWHFDVEGRFKPSISVDVITTMQSDMFYASSGIKVKSNFYSNSEVEAKLKVRGKNLVSFSFNLPQDNNEIFSARSELLVVKEDGDMPQLGIAKRKSNSTCTWPVLNEAMGLKMCSFYSVPDVTNTSGVVYPSLLLTGPLNFSIVLTKSDLTAKKYVFEYKWDQLDKQSSIWSLVFITPESRVQRLLVANVTSLANSVNTSVSFINGATTASAGCSYNKDPDNRSLDIFLDTNGNRSFDLSFELKRRQDRTAWVYTPKMLLTVKGVNITGLVGKIRINKKNGITQNDIELSFETKRLQALVRGIIVQTEVTTSTNMTINYRFQANKIETINIDGKLVDNCDKSKTEYRGNVNLITTAYPRLNFASNLTWLSVQGHTEGMVTYNNDVDLQDPQHTSLVRLIFARSQNENNIWEGSITRASFEVTVPRSKVDFCISAKHEERTKNGTEHNIILGLRYGPEKEATAIFSIHLPRRNLFAVDAFMNITIPEMNSCEARLKVNEYQSKDYMLNFNGTWFTGHNIVIKGNYKDRSSRVQALHHLKLIIDSPSFEQTSLNIVYRRGQLIIFLDAQGKYGADPYGLTMQYTTIGDSKNSQAEIRLKLKEKMYSVKAKLQSEQPKLLEIELHMDRLRDIHLKIGILTLEQRKEISVELKWDANRDPSQRLGFLAEYMNPGSGEYNGNAMITYPDRTISCGFEAYTGGPKYYGSVRASWSVNEVLMLTYNVGLMPGQDIHNWIHVDLITPFDGWQTNQLKAGIYNKNNLLLANVTLLWANSQNLELGYKSDYEITDSLVHLDIRCGINSTIRDIPTINVKVKHLQNYTKFDTDLALRYTSPNDTLNVYSLKSNWELFENERFQNVLGIIVMVSPFEGYRKGGLAAKFSLSDQRELLGAASLNFDLREFTLAMDGYVKKITDSMLTINITTPLEKFRTINVRLGLNEKRRHAVAEIRAPTSALGVEALCDIMSLMSFDVKLSVATPIDALQRAALIAKINGNTVDMRGIMNNITIGFSGVWRKHNNTDFEYSYRIFTPLHGFEENGFIAKYVKKDIFILELHGKLSHYKLGVKINGHPKSNLLKQLGTDKIELEILYDDDFQPPKLEDNDYEIDYDDFFSYFLEFELDTIIWNTIDGVIDIQEITDFYIVVGNVQLPQGRIDAKNRLHYPDYLNLLNVLSLNTPFPIAKEIKSTLEYHVDLYFNSFYDKLYIQVTNNDSHVTELGLTFNYTKVEDTLRPRQQNLHLNFLAPIEVLPELDIHLKLELDDTMYKGNISSKTRTTFLSLAGSIESEENFLETSIGMQLKTNVVPYYANTIYFKKDFTEEDNSVDILYEVIDGDVINRLQAQCNWHSDRLVIINANGKIQTTMLALKSIESDILLTRSSDAQLNLDFSVTKQNNDRIVYGGRANRKNDVVNVEIWTPIEQYRNISIHSSFIRNPSNGNIYQINGQLYRNKIAYDINGFVEMEKIYPVDMNVIVKPKFQQSNEYIEFKFNYDRAKGTEISFTSIEKENRCQINGIYKDTRFDQSLSLTIQSTEKLFSNVNLKGNIQTEGNGHINGNLFLQSPWKDYGLDYLRLHSDIALQQNKGKISTDFLIGGNEGRGNYDWSWIFGKDMQISYLNFFKNKNSNPREVHLSAKYIDLQSNLQHLNTGIKLNLDNEWNIDLNGSVNYRSIDDFQGELISLLPTPIGDVHHLTARYQGNLLSQQGIDPNVFIETKYNAEGSQRKTIARLTFRNVTDLQGMGHVEWGIQNNVSIVEGDFQVLRKEPARTEFYAKLLTPKYTNQDTLFLKGNFDDSENEYKKLVCSLDYPATQRIADIDFSFKTLSNMYGFINSTTPFLNVTWLRTEFNFSSENGATYRYLRGAWPQDTAFFQMHSTYTSHNWDDDFTGKIEIEVPLATRHKADIEYKLHGQRSEDNGQLKVLYNENQILMGIYKRTTLKKEHESKESTDITLENDMKPLGIHYVHIRSNGNQNIIQDIKHVEIFELRNVKNFNLTGELHNNFGAFGQEIKLVAIHPNRTVIFTTICDDQNKNVLSHKSKLELSPTVWIAYNFKIGNHSRMGNDSQDFIIELSYPKRSLTAEGWYWYAPENQLKSDMSFKWKNNNNEYESMTEKALKAGIEWKVEPLNRGDRDHQSFFFKLGHPNLEKDVTVKATYYRGLVDIIKANVVVDYSNDPSHLINMGLLLQDLHPYLGYTNYTLNMFALHPATQLDMQFNGSASALASYFTTQSYAYYKRDYFPAKHGKFLALIDLNKKEIEYERVSPYRTVRFWIVPNIQYPVYGINATVWDTPDTNNTGYLIIDLHKKYARMEINLTDDASQNLQMIGSIPNARSGFLEIWRNYEEIRIIDVSSYLKMNHSRLITGRFHWRPKIKEELKAKIHGIGNSIYNSFSEGIDFWIKSMYGESVETVSSVWTTAKEYNERFFQDLNELSVIEDDLEHLRLYLNQSYEANDFYIKTVVNFTLTILDELAIRNHIESLPKIFVEIWQAMGDSGKALRNSIVWLIEAIKKTYNNFIEVVNRFFHGESLQYISSLLGKGVEKYDKFVKDLHISFIKYVENLWNRFWVMSEKYWKVVLKRLEPHVFKFMSYIETTTWEFCKEVFDFIYQRTNELAESPYFNKVSTFTQDIDRLYKDIKSHDAITNLKKYSTIAWNFLKEKYFKLVPFGAELNEILTEIWGEIKELEKIDHVKVLIQKYHEILAKLEWIATELQLENRLHELYAIIRNNLRNYATNALETSDRYREGKTKFVFDPEVGVIDLEQKLPMSWHAFNETPKFEEIPEYKLLAQAQNLFSTTNSSILKYIYNLRSHLDPKTWLPPYYSRALLIDSRHYMTFDNRFVGLNLNFEERRRNTQCTYVLAHDFHQKNFTLLLEPSAVNLQSDIVATRKITLIIQNQLLEIDLGNDSVAVNGNPQPFFPMQLNDVIIHRDFDILSIHANTEFSLHCNMQFNLCWIEVSGWYFGHLAGVLGTMNNEHFDDFTMATNTIAKTEEEFTDSWSMHKCKQKKSTNQRPLVQDKVTELCKEFFNMGMLSACADTIDVRPFYDMCLDLSINSNPVKEGHPAVKGACTAALAYIEACNTMKIPLRVPHQCIFCQLTNGTYVSEATFVEISGNNVPQSSDVVFIVEAKPCNAKLTRSKSIVTIATAIEEQLHAKGITNNRYAVVAFGGQSPFDKPRSVLHENRVFVTDLNDLQKYFDHITVHNSTFNDILQAISIASKLNFRPGVSKTFILLSCSNCAPQNMHFDYMSILQYMLEEGVNLHILADTEFEFERTRKLRHFFGIDNELVYSKRYPDGDANTHQQLHAFKNNLGICMPLALETNGSVFSARRLTHDQKNPIKRFATIFAKRVAKSAQPNSNQTCECSGHNTAVSYMMCSPTTYPEEKFNEDYDSEFNWVPDDVGNYA